MLTLLAKRDRKITQATLFINYLQIISVYKSDNDLMPTGNKFENWDLFKIPCK